MLIWVKANNRIPGNFMIRNVNIISLLILILGLVVVLLDYEDPGLITH